MYVLQLMVPECAVIEHEARLAQAERRRRDARLLAQARAPERSQHSRRRLAFVRAWRVSRAGEP